MNAAVNELVRSILHKDSLSQCSVSELERLVAQYPYFGPAQFLLAQKLKEENSPAYQKHSQRAILYFQDHLWFDYLSRNEEITGTLIPPKPTDAIPAEPIQEETQIPVTEPEEIIAPLTSEIMEPLINDKPGESVILPLATEEYNPVPAEEEIAEENINEEEQTTEEIIAPLTSEIIEPLISDKPGESAILPLATEEYNPVPAEEEIPEESINEEEQSTEDGPLPELPQLKIEPIDISQKTLTFEPYHTVDYFASQGIRMKEEEDKPKDRFSRQLKSFTEWLKTMKRLPESETIIPPAASVDPRVTSMAEYSITDRQVLTEAMAEVWEKQGNPQKAIEIYGKLSLLDPAKSAYFAAKIEHLKTL